ncbi:MAG: 5-formyltetrahydrofolate cyclo-ligase [Selenomonas sp.]|nr:5-formyltetrahydrofolate cyclo-ligase [Selenomonadales bacterium]MDD7763490.1 5-formyltetrahydrofolate cyclo-ligase [Selenomonadales bacterium]MDY5716654.1 5-formyltetrahydrofolate cyclo-ligase [Selenomonas sp.]
MITEAVLAANKKALRASIKQKRRALSIEYRQQASRKMQAELTKLPCYQAAEYIMLYMAMQDEVQLDELIAMVLKDGKKAVIPLVTGAGLMEAVELSDMADLVPDKYGIKTVSEEKRRLIAPDKIDLIIVPGVAFDKAGHRLGMGGGFYDRFMLRASRAVRAALAYDCQLLVAVPAEVHDLTVDYIITEKQNIALTK